MFFKLVAISTQCKNEKVLLNVCIFQNTLSELLKIMEEHHNAQIYKIDFKKTNIMIFVYQWIEILEQLEFNDDFPFVASQLESSVSWSRIRQLKGFNPEKIVRNKMLLDKDLNLRREKEDMSIITVKTVSNMRSMSRKSERSRKNYMGTSGESFAKKKKSTVRASVRFVSTKTEKNPTLKFDNVNRL